MAMYVQPLHTILAVQTGGQPLKFFPRQNWVLAKYWAALISARIAIFWMKELRLIVFLGYSTGIRRSSQPTVPGSRLPQPTSTSSWEPSDFYYIWQTAKRYNWFAARNLQLENFMAQATDCTSKLSVVH
jgi:hypothetical protein